MLPKISFLSPSSSQVIKFIIQPTLDKQREWTKRHQWLYSHGVRFELKVWTNPIPELVPSGDSTSLEVRGFTQMVELNSNCVWGKQGRARLKMYRLMSVIEEARKAVGIGGRNLALPRRKVGDFSWVELMLVAECFEAGWATLQASI
jgi:hypothetical protein